MSMQELTPVERDIKQLEKTFVKLNPKQAKELKKQFQEILKAELKIYRENKEILF